MLEIEGAEPEKQPRPVGGGVEGGELAVAEVKLQGGLQRAGEGEGGRRGGGVGWMKKATVLGRCGGSQSLVGEVRGSPRWTD